VAAYIAISDSTTEVRRGKGALAAYAVAAKAQVNKS